MPPSGGEGQRSQTALLRHTTPTDGLRESGQLRPGGIRLSGTRRLQLRVALAFGGPGLPDQDVDLLGRIDPHQTFLGQFDVSDFPAGEAELEL